MEQIPWDLVYLDPRIPWVTSNDKSIWDARVKEHITSEPDVVIDMIYDDIEFIILASDGL